MPRGTPINIDETRSQRLAQFVEWVEQHIRGDEKGEAQVFLDRLFQAFNQRGILEAGGTLEFRVRKQGEDSGGVAFADLVWKPVVLIEMKKRGADLNRHFRQAFDYWVNLVPNRPKYVVLCNFDEFRIYDFDQQIDEPMDVLALRDLPTRYGPLNFLFPTREKPHFQINRLEVTQAAADRLAYVHGKLRDRTDVGPVLAQRFILQMLIALFSEDIGLLPKYFVQQLLDDCTDPPRAFDLLGGLFRAMNSPERAGGGRFKDVPYFNGGIFDEPAPVELGTDELAPLKEAAREDWSHISPDIFGTIFQHSMDGRERHKYGGHYTSPADIMKIVGPTIVRPWREAIARARTPAQLRGLQQRLYQFRVLDPACGSGNFLYIAYRELRRIEHELLERLAELAPARNGHGQRAFGFVRTRQFFGLDIVPFAVELAKVTLTLAHKLSIDELHIDEPALPLDNLDENIRCVDALIDWPIDGSTPADFDPMRSRSITPWPEADVIIGNPPFLGAKRLKPERGTDYVNAVRRAYPDVPGMADYCVYWIRRAHDHLPECVKVDPLRGRAGLVGTQNIRNNQSRVGGLDYVVRSGGGTIVEAVDNQPWSGEANVHVSIVNWVKHAPSTLLADLRIPAHRRLWQRVDPALPPDDAEAATFGRTSTIVRGKRGKPRGDKSYELAYREVASINSALSDSADLSVARVLAVNTDPQRSFQGVVPGYKGFVVSLAQRDEWRAADRRNVKVVRPFLIGCDVLTTGVPTRAIIDLDDLALEHAAGYAKPFAHLRDHVLPQVRRSAAKAARSDMARARAEHLDRWWQFWNVRKGLRKTLRPLRRYLACARVTKRPVFVFVSTVIVPDGALQTFAFNDDYSFGILQSSAHWSWFTAKCSKLTERFRYTPESVFDTFPWPQGKRFRGPTKRQVEAVAKAGREVRRLREEAMKSIPGGLRAMYRTLELPGRSPLKDAHAALDDAVLECYGFTPPPKGDILQQLLDLNLEVAARIDAGEPVVAPGIPPSYPTTERESLVTDDCIRPPA